MRNTSCSYKAPPHVKAHCLELYLTKTRSLKVLVELTGCNKTLIQRWIKEEKWPARYRAHNANCMKAVEIRVAELARQAIPEAISRHLDTIKQIDTMVLDNLNGEENVRSLKELKTAAEAIKSGAQVIAPIIHPKNLSKSEGNFNSPVFRGPVLINYHPMPDDRSTKQKHIEAEAVEDITDFPEAP